MSKKTYIRAEEGKPPGISVIYYDTDGNETIRYHDKNGKIGSHAWRNNNPGNLGWGSGDHAKKTGMSSIKLFNFRIAAHTKSQFSFWPTGSCQIDSRARL